MYAIYYSAKHQHKYMPLLYHRTMGTELISLEWYQKFIQELDYLLPSSKFLLTLQKYTCIL